MIKAKEVSVKNVAVILIVSFAISAGYFVSRKHIYTRASTPVFIGDEITIQRVAPVAVSAVKTVTAPLPAPPVVAPLPVIPPSISYKVLPEYPASALAKGREGAVLLSVYIGPSGQPEKVETKVSSGIKEFDASAVKAVSEWKFTPAAQGGAAMASWYEVPVRFEVK
jgi:TonB family protein